MDYFFHKRLKTQDLAKMTGLLTISILVLVTEGMNQGTINKKYQWYLTSLLYLLGFSCFTEWKNLMADSQTSQTRRSAVCDVSNFIVPWMK